MNINDFVVRFANVNGTCPKFVWDMQKFLYIQPRRIRAVHYRVKCDF